MLNIITSYNESYIDSNVDMDLLVKLDNELKYRPEGYQHTWYFKNKKWDGYNRLFDMNTKRFKTGLVYRVCRFLKRENVEFKINDLRPMPEQILDISKNFRTKLNPFNYQLQAVDSTSTNDIGIIASPTGSGKTLVIALIIERHSTRSLVLVNSRVLLDQTYDALVEMFPGQVGIIGDGDFELNNIVVATVQSVSKILGIGKKQTPTDKEHELQDWLNNTGLTILDEVHESDNDSVGGICARLKCKKIFGTTATPYKWMIATEKGVNLAIEQNFGVKIYDSREIVDFIKLGITVPLYINKFATPIVPDFEGRTRGTKEDDYKEIIDKQVIGNKARTELIAKKAKELVDAGCSCYVYFKIIKHGEELCELLSGLDPLMMQGSTSRSKRTKILEQINSKKKLLVVSDIGSYGLNIPSLDSVIMAHPLRDFRQIKGRTCRANPGKKYGLILDPIDMVPILTQHAKLRQSQAKADGDIVVGW